MSANPRTDPNATVDWGPLYAALYGLAVSLFRGRVVNADSAEDLVSKTFIEFLASSDGIGWDGQPKSLGPHLWAVLPVILIRRALDDFRREKKIVRGDIELVAPSRDLDRALFAEELQQRLPMLVKDNHLTGAQLQRFMVALGETESGRTNQEVAREQNLPIAVVRGVLKKIREALRNA